MSIFSDKGIGAAAREGFGILTFEWAKPYVIATEWKKARVDHARYTNIVRLRRYV